MSLVLVDCQMEAKRRVLLAWSSGKDSAWTLHILRQQSGVEVVGLLTTFNDAVDRVAMHAVRRSLVEHQAAATGLPLWSVPLPWPCSNEEYERRMGTVIERARQEEIGFVAFGDLFLEEVRAYRERMLAGTGVAPLFPIWGTQADTAGLAQQMIGAGFRTVLTCVDTRQLDERYVGREFDADLLKDLPAAVDPCGEKGEFHSFCYAGPIFTQAIPIQRGERLERDGFVYMDLVPVTA